MFRTMDHPRIFRSASEDGNEAKGAMENIRIRKHSMTIYIRVPVDA